MRTFGKPQNVRENVLDSSWDNIKIVEPRDELLGFNFNSNTTESPSQIARHFV